MRGISGASGRRPRGGSLAMLAFVLAAASLAGADDPRNPPAPPEDGSGWRYLPDDRVFDPLVADPRWPQFSASYGSVSGAANPRVANSGRVSLGESFTLLEYEAGPAERFGAGIQPVVYALFDLNASGNKL